MSERAQKQLKSLTTFISRWRGREGELFGLSVSIKTLTIVFRGDDPKSNLCLACVDPTRIEANARWKEHGMRVEIIEQPGQEVLYRLLDEEAGLKVECGRIDAFENRKLW